MAEDLVLTTPVTRPSTTTWRVTRLELDWGVGAHIGIHLVGSDGSRRSVGYNDVDDMGNNTGVATGLMSALNTANLSVKSLHKRILERVAADFPDLDGSVTGTPV